MIGFLSVHLYSYNRSASLTLVLGFWHASNIRAKIVLGFSKFMCVYADIVPKQPRILSRVHAGPATRHTSDLMATQTAVHAGSDDPRRNYWRIIIQISRGPAGNSCDRSQLVKPAGVLTYLEATLGRWLEFATNHVNLHEPRSFVLKCELVVSVVSCGYRIMCSASSEAALLG